MENRGLGSPYIGHESLWRDYENIQDDYRPPCTYISEGEDDQELLENLEALDPCGEYDDVEYSNRVKNFLEKYEKEISKEVCTPPDWESAPSPSTSQAKISDEAWSDLRMFRKKSNHPESPQ